MQPDGTSVTVPGTRRRRRTRKGRGCRLSAGNRESGAMGDAPSPEEKLHLITRNLQVGPWGWDAPLGTEDLKSRDSPYQSLNVWGRGLRAWAALRPSLLVDQ